MTTHALALTNLLTFLLEHHAEDIGGVSYSATASTVWLQSPPKGATMLGWEWEQSALQNQLLYKTPSGIFVFAPSTEVSA
jgi:hypothetical protein